MKTSRGRLNISVFAAVVLALLAPTSCIFDAAPPEPEFPSELLAVISIGSSHGPSLVKCLPGSELALVAAGSELIFLDIYNGEESGSVDLNLEIDDIADSGADGFAYVLTDSLLYAVDAGSSSAGAPFDLGEGAEFISVSAMEDLAWLCMDDDSLLRIDLSSMEMSTVRQIMPRDCQGIASSGDGNLFLALGGEDAIVGYDPEDWTEVGRVPVPGDVIDLFPGPEGYVCAIVHGSNEVWFIRTSDCFLYKMITVPETPTAAGIMPKGDYALVSCQSAGFLIVSENGQIEFRSSGMGLPVSIDVSSDGSRAVLCCEDEGEVIILEE